MQIQNNSCQTFGNNVSPNSAQRNRESFYEMNTDSKLNTIYEMLNQQKEDLVTLSKNQNKIQKCNKYTTDILSAFSLNDPSDIEKSLEHNNNVYNAHKINILA